MEAAIIGLGKMGTNMTRRLLHDGQRVFVHDIDTAAMNTLEWDGAERLESLDELVEALSPPRVVWVMVPAGDPVENTIRTVCQYLERRDIIVDGGNSNYKDTLRRATMLQNEDLFLVDVGTSGGVWGLTEGYSMMVGGEAEAVETVTPLLRSLAPAPDKGWGHVGPPGSGHFVKMVHNGIEYGLMQAYAEGFDLMAHKKEFDLDVHQVAEIWRYGSVVRSWLLDLAADALAENPELDDIAAYVTDSGEGRWTVAEAIELNVAIPVISMSLQRRFRSRDKAPFADKMLAALRGKFGGHSVAGTDDGQE
jgi:6-phosphogluconate dehydrogenase